MNRIIFLTLCFVTTAISISSADQVELTGGQSSLVLSDQFLTDAGLTVSSTTPNVISPGSLGADSLAFTINPRDAALNPTSFVYEIFSLLPTTGTVEHAGSVFFNSDTLEFGNFSIGFDGGRTSATNSGFFLESTTGTSVILFDLDENATVSAQATSLTVEAQLFVSPELAFALSDPDVSAGDLAGLIKVEGTAIPEPSSLGVISLLAAAGVARRRRR